MAPNPKTIYVVMQQAWEYNDEYYYTPEGDAGRSVRAFTKLADAETHARELNIGEMITDDNPFNYSAEYGLDLYEKIEELNIPGVKANQYELVIPEDIAQADAEKIFDLLEHRWFYVEEVVLLEEPE